MPIRGNVCNWYNPTTKKRCRSSHSGYSCEIDCYDRYEIRTLNDDSLGIVKLAKEIFPNARSFGRKGGSYIEFDTDIGSFRYYSWWYMPRKAIKIQMQADYDEYKHKGTSSDMFADALYRDKKMRQRMGLDYNPDIICRYRNCKRPKMGRGIGIEDPDACASHQPNDAGT